MYLSRCHHNQVYVKILIHLQYRVHHRVVKHSLRRIIYMMTTKRRKRVAGTEVNNPGNRVNCECKLNNNKCLRNKLFTEFLIEIILPLVGSFLSQVKIMYFKIKGSSYFIVCILNGQLVLNVLKMVALTKIMCVTLRQGKCKNLSVF